MFHNVHSSVYPTHFVPSTFCLHSFIVQRMKKKRKLNKLSFPTNQKPKESYNIYKIIVSVKYFCISVCVCELLLQVPTVFKNHHYYHYLHFGSNFNNPRILIFIFLFHFTTFLFFKQFVLVATELSVVVGFIYISAITNIISVIILTLYNIIIVFFSFCSFNFFAKLNQQF